MIPGEKKPPRRAVATQRQHADDRRRSAAAGRPRRTGARRRRRRNKTLTFEYELAAGKLTLLDERPPRKPRWASVSPDDKTVVFARNHNLYMMDAANYAKALKKPTTRSIVETQLTTDGVEDFGYPARRGRAASADPAAGTAGRTRAHGRADAGQERAGVPAIMISWSQRFQEVRRGAARSAQGREAVGDQLAGQSAAHARDLSLRHAGRGETPQSQLEIFDVAAKSRVDR